MIYLCSVIALYHCNHFMVHITQFYFMVQCFMQYYAVSIFYHKSMYNIIIVLYKQNILVVVVVGTFSGKNRSLIVLTDIHCN